MDEIKKAKVDYIKSNVFRRLNGPTPEFFKKIITIGISLGTIGAGIVAAPTAGVKLPDIVITIGGYMIAIGYIAALIAKTTVDSEKVN